MTLYDYYLANIDNDVVFIEYIHGVEPCLLVNGKYLVRVKYAKKILAQDFFGGIL